MIGYFKFVDDGVTKNGLFHKFDGNQFFSVQLFQAVEKMTDRNDPQRALTHFLKGVFSAAGKI